MVRIKNGGGGGTLNFWGKLPGRLLPLPGKSFRVMGSPGSKSQTVPSLVRCMQKFCITKNNFTQRHRIFLNHQNFKILVTTSWQQSGKKN